MVKTTYCFNDIILHLPLRLWIHPSVQSFAASPLFLPHRPHAQSYWAQSALWWSSLVVLHPQPLYSLCFSSDCWLASGNSHPLHFWCSSFWPIKRNSLVLLTKGFTAITHRGRNSNLVNGTGGGAFLGRAGRQVVFGWRAGLSWLVRWGLLRVYHGGGNAILEAQAHRLTFLVWVRGALVVNDVQLFAEVVKGETHDIEKVSVDVLHKHATESLNTVATSLVPDKQRQKHFTHTETNKLCSKQRHFHI